MILRIVSVILLLSLTGTLSAQQAEFNRAMVGRVVPLLLEKPGRHAGQLVGRSPWLQAVHVTADGHRAGDMVDVRIDAVQPNSLAGRLASVQPEDAAA